MAKKKKTGGKNSAKVSGKNSMKAGIGTVLRRFRGIGGIAAALALAVSVLFAVFPDALHVVRYYVLEWSDAALDCAGLLPEYDNLAFGAPVSLETDRIFEREGYAYGFSEVYEQPLWVSYKLTARELENVNAERRDDFREDPRILTRSASLEDYKGSGFARGHLAPAADMKWSATAMSESFFMSNMCPQYHSFNSGIWLKLENAVRDIARREKEIYVISGPVFYPGKGVSVFGENAVAVPHAYYKVIYDLTPPQKMIAFIIPHSSKKDSSSLKKYAVSVEDVEEVTRLTFFPELGAAAEKLKDDYTYSDWSIQ